MRRSPASFVAMAAVLLGTGLAALVQAGEGDGRAAAMVFVPAGTVTIGDDAAPRPERPAFRAAFKGFYMDSTPVTVKQFSAFVRTTGFRTDAERLGTGLVLREGGSAWGLVRGANWRQPYGPGEARAPADHPVTQVSWNDAAAFCRHYGARLPSEFEWERAARLGQMPDGHVLKAGDPLSMRDRYYANVWQGVFPLIDEGKDGFRTTSPVGYFGAAPSGLSDMAGNVWEWTDSWYRPYIGRPVSERGSATERVQRGGSYLCDANSCQGFRASARGHSTPDTSSVHIGFRCAADVGGFSSRAGVIKPAPHS